MLLKSFGIINTILFSLFSLCYTYQVFFVFIRFLRVMPRYTAEKQHRYAVLIPARNESAVLSCLLQSIEAQQYPKELLDVYVIADNCTDETATIAENYGAQVIHRYNQKQVGKGYALQHAFEAIDRSKGVKHYDGYFVFDADNQLDSHFVEEMNHVFDQGYIAVTSYRNSKNYGSNWLTAGYSLWFLKESYFLNGTRMLLGNSCAISGTGFLISSNLIEELGGWPYHLLTEDIQFSVSQVLQGKRIGYAEQAILYDEQPFDFETSWRQRMRWAKGFYQVLGQYGSSLIRNSFRRGGFASYDLLMTIAPASLITIALWVFNGSFLLFGLFIGNSIYVRAALISIITAFSGTYAYLFFHGLVTTITQWKQIRCTPLKKILFIFTFPLFLFTYIPISWAALHQEVTWEPIKHVISDHVA